MIDLIFEIFVLKSIGSAALLILIIAIRPMILKWMNARVAYGLWLMLPIYLLLPINFVEVSSTGGLMTFFLGTENLPVDLIEEGFFAENLLASWSLIIWAIGFIISTMIFLFKYRRLIGSLKYIDQENISQYARYLENGSNTQLQLVTSPLIDVPAIFGLFRSYLILPKSFFGLPKQSQQAILSHELYHLNRNDHRVNFIRVLFKSLFWFNPLFYIADRYCEADQEISCDLGVLENSKPEGRAIYAKVLLESVAGVTQNRLVSQWKYQSLIKERVKMLNNIQAKKWHSWVACILAAGAIWLTSGVVMAKPDGIGENEAIPLVITNPRYPRKAAMEGIEGWVKVRFDLDSNGFPYELSVINASPEGIFENDALRAVRQWKFKTENGQKDLIYTLQFKLAADSKVSDNK